MSPIWFNKLLKLEDLKGLGEGTMGSHLGIKFCGIGPDFISATMPVDERTRQPYGLLHGGASVVLAETLGSVGSFFVIDNTKFLCVGLEVNANHLRSVREGIVTGIATPFHLGATTHVWNIKIVDSAAKVICISRLTVAILKNKEHRT